MQSFIRPEEFWKQLELRAGQTVVHLGCGAGYYLIPAARMVGKHGLVIGVDIRPDMLAAAEKRAAEEDLASIVQLRRADLERKASSGVDDGTADWTLLANILHQADPIAVFYEARRITKPTGRVIAVEWETVATPLGPPAEKRIAQSAITAAAKQTGLRVEREFKPSPYHYGLLCAVA